MVVKFAWSEGDPVMSVSETDRGFDVVVHVRLSESQGERACTELGAMGDEVCVA